MAGSCSRANGVAIPTACGVWSSVERWGPSHHRAPTRMIPGEMYTSALAEVSVDDCWNGPQEPPRWISSARLLLSARRKSHLSTTYVGSPVVRSNGRRVVGLTQGLCFDPRHGARQHDSTAGRRPRGGPADGHALNACGDHSFLRLLLQRHCLDRWPCCGLGKGRGLQDCVECRTQPIVRVYTFGKRSAVKRKKATGKA